MATNYILPKQTAAATGEDIDLTEGPFPMTIHVAGTLVAEEIDVFVVDDDGDEEELYDADGVIVTIGATSQPLTIPSPIILRFDKPITTNAVGLQLRRISSPVRGN